MKKSNSDFEALVTDRKRADEALRRSEAHLAEVHKLSQTGSFCIRVASQELVSSAETVRIGGWEPGTTPSLEQALERVHPEDRERVQTTLERALREGSLLEYEHRLLLPDGSIRHVHTVANAIRDASGEVELVGAVLDITERKNAAEALRSSEHLARGQLDALEQVMTALSRESEPEKFLEHVLRITTEQLGARSLSVWEMNEAIGRLDLVAIYDGGRMHLASREDAPPARMRHEMEDHPVWTEFFHTGERCIYGLIDTDPPGARVSFCQGGPWFDWSGDTLASPRVTEMVADVADSGVVSTLCVPLFVGGKVTGMFSIRFSEHRTFRREEIDLTRAMTHQAVLAIRSIRLSQQSREVAIVAERNRVARDIHDTLAQGFTGVILQLEAAKDATTQGDLAEAANRIGRASELARSSLGEARRSVWALRPRSLRDGRLFLAIRDLLERMTGGTSLKAELQAAGDERSMPADFEEGLLRITQEALTNTVKHANARNFTASLSVGASKVQLRLVDDGCGFAPQAEHDGFGLIGMKERVDRMGGEFMIRTKPGVGTEILVELSIHTAPKPENRSGQG